MGEIESTALERGLDKRYLIISAIGIAAAGSILVFMYQYSIAISRVESISADSTRSNAEIQVHDLASLLSSQISGISITLQTLSESPAIQDNDLARAERLLGSAGEAGRGLVDFYMWLDHEGRIVTISGANATILEQYRGFDLSYRSYFTTPRETRELFFSSVIESNDMIQRIYLSSPILDNSAGIQGNNQAGLFEGVLVAAVRVDVLGNFLQSQVSEQMEGQVGVIDRNGIIIYYPDSEYIENSVFDVEYQSLLRSQAPENYVAINSAIEELMLGSSGSQDVKLSGAGSTFAYEPVYLNGAAISGIYISVPHRLSTEMSLLIQQQTTLFLIHTFAIVAASTASSIMFLSWNRKLKRNVEVRTTELRAANESLAERNEKLDKMTRSLKDSNEQLAEVNRQLSHANEQLKVHDVLQKEFINVAAHELRTPVTPILMAIDMSQRDGSTGAITLRPEEFDLIVRNAKRLKRLAESILDVARIESRTLKLKFEEINLDELISSAVDEAETQIHQADVRIEYTPTDIFIIGDRERLYQVLSNLLSNAIRFTTSGVISIRLERSDEEIIFRIKDSGRGIDQSFMKRLFTKFATNSEMGTGLGLFLSRSIIEAHGGRIWAENNPDSKGATFSFSLPVRGRGGEIVAETGNSYHRATQKVLTPRDDPSK